MADPDILNRLESLENGLREVKDLYLSVKLEFMEMKKGLGKSPSGPIAPEAPSADVGMLRDQVESLQETVLKLQDDQKSIKAEPKTVVKQGPAPSAYMKEIEALKREMENFKSAPAGDSGISRSEIDRIYREISSLKSSRPSPSSAGSSIDRAEIDRIYKEISSLRSSIPSQSKSEPTINRAEIDRIYREMSSLKSSIESVSKQPNLSAEQRIRSLDEKLSREISSIKMEMSTKDSVKDLKSDVSELEKSLQARMSEIDRVMTSKISDLEKTMASKISEIETGFATRAALEEAEEALKRRIDKILRYEKELIDEAEVISRHEYSDYTKGVERLKAEEEPINTDEGIISKDRPDVYEDEKFREKVNNLRRMLDRL